MNARIFAIGDVFDALSSGRPYKEAYTYDKTMAYLHEQCGRQFDPGLCEGFRRISRDMCDRIATRDRPELDELIHQMIIAHFNIDLADTRLKSKYSVL